MRLSKNKLLFLIALIIAAISLSTIVSAIGQGVANNSIGLNETTIILPNGLWVIINPYATEWWVLINSTNMSFSATAADSINVTLNSTSDPTGFVITLNESNATSGFFNITVNGSPNFALRNITLNASIASSDANNFILKVAQGDKISVNATVNGSARNALAQIAQNTSMYLNATVYSYDVDTPAITLVDNDLDLTDSLDTVSVTINSTSNFTGVTIILTETTVHSGTFQLNTTNDVAIDFSADSTSDATNLLKVAAGDLIRINYTDTNSNPNGSTRRTFEAVIDQNGTIVFNGTGFLSHATIVNETISVTDMGNNTNITKVDQIRILLNSTSSGSGFTVTLNESGVNTGIFNITVNATSGAPQSISLSTNSGEAAASTYTLQVAQGDNITLRYVDVSNFSTKFVNRNVFDGARIYQNGSAALNATVYITGYTINITIRDNDNNTNIETVDTVNVILNSTSSRVGLNITLNETGVNTGVFNIPVNRTASAVAKINFSESTTTETGTYYQLYIGPGSQIMVTLIDNNPDARTYFYARMDMPTNFSINSTNAPGSANYSFRQNVSFGLSGLNITDQGNNTNETTVQQITVRVNSTSDRTGVIIRLNESGADTGVFNRIVNYTGTTYLDAILNFSESGTSVTTNSYYTLVAAQGDNVSFVITDVQNLTHTATRAISSDIKLWSKSGLSLNATVYTIGTGFIGITVTDSDNNTDAGRVDSVTIQLNSTSWVDPINITLNESGANTGIFNVIINSTSTALQRIQLTDQGETNDSTYTLRVKPRDFVTALMADTFPIEPTVQVVAVIDEAANVTLNATSYWNESFANSATMNVTDMGNNTNISKVDQIRIIANSTVNRTGITIILNESGVNTGIFNRIVNSTYADVKLNLTIDTTALSGDQNGYYTLIISQSNNFSFVVNDAQNYSDRIAGGRNMYRSAMIQTEGIVTLNASIYITGFTINISVYDPDNDTLPSAVDNITIILNSSTDRDGIILSLNETGADTDYFKIPVNLTSGKWVPLALNISRVSAVDTENGTQYELNTTAGDLIMVTYIETTPNGRRYAYARMEMGGVVNWSNTGYNQTSNPTIMLTDYGLDTNTTLQQTVTVIINSTSLTSGVNVTLTEIAVSSGVFFVSNTTQVALSPTTASSNASDILQVNPGDKIMVIYDDALNVTGANPSLVYDKAVVFVTANITLNASYYNLTASPGITIVDPDANTNESVANQVNVTIYTDSDSTGIVVTLNESSHDSGIFNISVNYTSTSYLTVPINFSSSTDTASYYLNTAEGDALIVRYQDGNNSNGARQNRTDDAMITIRVPLRNAGWNQFSTPYTLESNFSNYSMVFADTGVNITYYLNASGGNWVQVQSSDTVSPLRGYYVKTNNDNEKVILIPVKGEAFRNLPGVDMSPITTVTLSLSTGYNFVGINYVATQTTNATFSSLKGTGANPEYWTSIIEYDTTQTQGTEYIVSAGGYGSMTKGRAYWIHMNTASTYSGLQTR